VKGGSEWSLIREYFTKKQAILGIGSVKESSLHLVAGRNQGEARMINAKKGGSSERLDVQKGGADLETA